MLPAPHSAVASLLWHSKQKKRIHYMLNTRHFTLQYTLTIHSKHAKYHKSLNSQHSLLPPSLSQLSPLPQQPNAVCNLSFSAPRPQPISFRANTLHSYRQQGVHNRGYVTWRNLCVYLATYWTVHLLFYAVHAWFTVQLRTYSLQLFYLPHTLFTSSVTQTLRTHALLCPLMGPHHSCNTTPPSWWQVL